MNPFFRRIPEVVWSGILALLLTLVVGGAWTALLIGDLAISPAIPWAVPVMAFLLWLMWRYLGGAWWPESSSAVRRRALRARPVDGIVMTWALAAGVLSIVSLAGLWIVLFQLANLPTERVLLDSSRYPVTIGLVLVMASVVSSVPEEAGFRGYFQGALERRVSGPGAILITAAVMAPEHALTQGFLWPTLLFYACVDIMLGTMAYLTNSILPGIVVHFIGLVTFFTLVWPGDALRQLVGRGGPQIWFSIHIGQVVIFGMLAAIAFLKLARCTKALHSRSSFSSH